MAEQVYDIYWEGPFKWDEKESKIIKPYHVLYQIYGHHPVYGSNKLLYIGMTERGIQRINEHDAWVCYEFDPMTVRVGSLGKFTNWADWEKPGHYGKADRKIVEKIEALLIYAHQPSYNATNKSSAEEKSRDIRVFNSGTFGQLLPELSYTYYFGE